MDARKPDWSVWSRQAKARAWECLALSVDVEPRELGVDHFLVLRSSEAGASMATERDPAWLLEMCSRLTTLAGALADAPASLRAGRGKATDMEAELKLSGFADWARDRKWELPEELAALTAAKTGDKPKAKASAKAPTKPKAAPKKDKKAPAAPKNAAKSQAPSKKAAKSKPAPKAVPKKVAKTKPGIKAAPKKAVKPAAKKATKRKAKA